MNNNINDVVTKTRESFGEYFDMVGGKNFKQFYYDWHIDNMLAPFAGMVEYFAKNHGENAAQKFHDFVVETTEWLDSYDVDKPQRSLINTKRYSNTNDGKLSNYLDGVRTFGFEVRQFIYSFGTREDHHAEFGYWPVKANMPYSSKHGMMIAKDILLNLDKNFNDIKGSADVYRAGQKAADTYLRQSVAKQYTYNDKYNFETRKKAIKQLHDLRNVLSLTYRQSKNLSPEMSELFQVEQKEAPMSKTSYWPNGFELEFYVPEQFSD